jgi:hypothetical protein
MDAVSATVDRLDADGAHCWNVRWRSVGTGVDRLCRDGDRVSGRLVELEQGHDISLSDAFIVLGLIAVVVALTRGGIHALCDVPFRARRRGATGPRDPSQRRARLERTKCKQLLLTRIPTRAVTDKDLRALDDVLSPTRMVLRSLTGSCAGMVSKWSQKARVRPAGDAGGRDQRGAIGLLTGPLLTSESGYPSCGHQPLRSFPAIGVVGAHA